MSDVLDESIENISGVGEVRLKQFGVLGIKSVRDLITYYPRAYEDRRKIKKIADLQEGDSCSFIGTVSSFGCRFHAKKIAVYNVVVKDDTSSIVLVFFNQHYIKNALIVGRTFVFYGKVGRKRNARVVENPVFASYVKGKINNIARIVPVYSSTAGLSQNVLRNTISRAVSIAKDALEDFMPSDMREKIGLVTLAEAIYGIHMPRTHAHFVHARKRLVFDEFFLLQMALFSIKKNVDVENNELKMEIKPECKAFIKNLSFELTKAQKRTIKEVFRDMQSDKVMNRLIQGDVGCGKTIVAVIALLNVVKNGYQGIFLAPTEILARQHYDVLTKSLSEYGVEVGLLVGGMRKREKNRIKDGIMLGQVDVVIGTHAILQEDIVFCRVGLVITDEQHRFGVGQRALLGQKGDRPHVLAMSATPIPRTLSLILYGDLDISIIDELPPERKPVKTVVVGEDKRERVNNFIRQKVREGRQVYIVCPLVEESETMDLKSAMTFAEELGNKEFCDLKVGLIHGKLRGSKKDEIMNAFMKGDIDILISTTVIEVGVNVPNASVMVIENAERFGLSTLHQLRGRVGRGDKEAFCVLVTQNRSKDNVARMEIMRSTNDGFVVARKDLEMRGMGDFFGTRQHGLPDLKLANMYDDMDILKIAQKWAQLVMNESGEEGKFSKMKKEVYRRFLKKLGEGIVLN